MRLSTCPLLSPVQAAEAVVGRLGANVTWAAIGAELGIPVDAMSKFLIYKVRTDIWPRTEHGRGGGETNAHHLAL